jgi:hypothetical protein
MATEARETADFIGSDKVEGTTVYDAKGEKMGSIERVMIEKRSGQVANRAPALLLLPTRQSRTRSWKYSP